MQVRGIAETGFRAIMPEISRVGANMTIIAHKRIVTINRRAVKLIIVFGIPMFAILFVLTEFLLKLWLRKNFVETLPSVFRIILIGTFLNLLCVPAFYTLLGLGKARYYFFSSAIQGIVNVMILTSILLVSGEMSVHIVVWSVTISISMTSFYILWQKHRAMKNNLLEITNGFGSP
jgi:O-antigen/teichoic acid export membrane protein